MSRRWRNLRGFLFFAGPSTFAFVSITIAAFIVGVVLTFTNWNGLESDFSFSGLANYREAVTDGEFWSSMWMTSHYVLAVVVLANVLAFAIAYALFDGVRWRGILRAGFFTPNLIGGVVLGFIWYFIFSQGLVSVGSALGIDALSTSWLASERMAFWALVIATVWQLAGFLVVIYMAGLSTLPRTVMEAASMDGAGGWRRMSSVVLPLMRSTFTICVFLTIGRCFLTYDLNLALTNGGPYGSTELVAMHVYRKAFEFQDFGTGQAQALVLFVIVAAISVLQVSVSRRGEVEL